MKKVNWDDACFGRNCAEPESGEETGPGVRNAKQCYISTCGQISNLHKIVFVLRQIEEERVMKSDGLGGLGRLGGDWTWP